MDAASEQCFAILQLTPDGKRLRVRKVLMEFYNKWTLVLYNRASQSYIVKPSCYRDTMSIFGLARRAGAFAGGLMTFALVSGFQLAEHNRGQCHFRNAAFSSQLEGMVDGALTRVSVLRVGLGVGGTTIASGSCGHPSHSWTSRLLTSYFCLGVSSLFCLEPSVCESCRFLNFNF